MISKQWSTLFIVHRSFLRNNYQSIVENIINKSRGLCSKVRLLDGIYGEMALMFQMCFGTVSSLGINAVSERLTAGLPGFDYHTEKIPSASKVLKTLSPHFI